MFDAILFDNDGVLVDTESLYYRANRDVLATVGVHLNEATYVELYLRQGVGAFHLAAARGLSPDAIVALRAARNRLYNDLVAHEDISIPGVFEVVRRLAARYRLAIVTSAEPEPFARTHARTGLLPLFELVLTRADTVRAKPAPDPYLLAVSRLGVPAARCLVIEDSERGLRAAKAAGLSCWVVPSGLTRGSNFGAADGVLPDLAAAAARLLNGDIPRR
ncbi:MAG TPA: HAD family phosphatase [Polyangia bacterium]|nr:HAD family phosphatase [Polyangia bacterium]